MSRAVKRLSDGLRSVLGFRSKSQEEPEEESSGSPDPSLAELREGMKAMRELLRGFGAALGAGATALLTGLGYTQVHKIFPLPADYSVWMLLLAIGASVSALVGAAWLAGRFFGAQRRIGIGTEPGEKRHFLRSLLRGRIGGEQRDTLFLHSERELRDRVFADGAAEEEAVTLRDVELRALRLQRIARRTTDETQAKKLNAEADRLRGRVRLVLVRAAAEILERRSYQAFKGSLTKVALLLAILGIVGTFGLADWSQGQRDLIGLRKSCAEAKKAGAIDACVTVVPKKDRQQSPKRKVRATQKSPWLNSFLATKLPTTRTLYRVYGGDSDRRGRWVTGLKPTSRRAAVLALALPPQNAARCLLRVRIPAGTRVRIGHVAPHFGRKGGASRVQILGTLKRVRYFADRPLPPAKGPCP